MADETTDNKASVDLECAGCGSRRFQGMRILSY